MTTRSSSVFCLFFMALSTKSYKQGQSNTLDKSFTNVWVALLCIPLANFKQSLEIRVSHRAWAWTANKSSLLQSVQHFVWNWISCLSVRLKLMAGQKRPRGLLHWEDSWRAEGTCSSPRGVRVMWCLCWVMVLRQCHVFVSQCWLQIQ